MANEQRNITIPETPSGEWLNSGLVDENGDPYPDVAADAIRRLAKRIQRRLGRRLLRNIDRTRYRITQARNCPNEKIIEYPVGSGNEYVVWDPDKTDTVIDAIPFLEWEGWRNGTFAWENINWLQVPSSDDVKLYKVGAQRQRDLPEWMFLVDEWIDPVDGSRHAVMISISDLIRSLGIESQLIAYASDGDLTKQEIANLINLADPDNLKGWKNRFLAWWQAGEFDDVV